MKTKAYALLNTETKASSQIISTSYDAAVMEFTGASVIKLAHQSRQFRIYHVNGQRILAAAA